MYVYIYIHIYTYIYIYIYIYIHTHTHIHTNTHVSTSPPPLHLREAEVSAARARLPVHVHETHACFYRNRGVAITRIIRNRGAASALPLVLFVTEVSQSPEARNTVERRPLGAAALRYVIHQDRFHQRRRGVHQARPHLNHGCQD